MWACSLWELYWIVEGLPPSPSPLTHGTTPLQLDCQMEIPNEILATGQWLSLGIYLYGFKKYNWNWTFLVRSLTLNSSSGPKFHFAQLCKNSLPFGKRLINIFRAWRCTSLDGSCFLFSFVIVSAICCFAFLFNDTSEMAKIKIKKKTKIETLPLINKTKMKENLYTL